MTLCGSGFGADGYYDETGHWQRTKHCFVSCGDRCTCGPPGGIFYNPLYDKRRGWRKYRRKGSTEARPWTEQDESAFILNGRKLAGVSVSLPDERLQTRIGGFVARNTDNHEDMWYVSKEYADKNWEEEGDKRDPESNG